MNIDNIKKLVKYDWVMNRNSLLRILAVLEVISVILFALYAMSCSFFAGSLFAVHLQLISAFSVVFEKVALLAVLVWCTHMLRRKVTDTKFAVHYLMLPASASDKALANHIAFFAAWLGTIVLSRLNTVLFCALAFLRSDTTGITFSDVLSFIFSTPSNPALSLYMSVIYSIATSVTLYLFFVIFCLQFKKHVVTKSIISLCLAAFAYSIYSGIVSSLLTHQSAISLGVYNDVAAALVVLLLAGASVCLYKAFTASLKERELK